MSALKNISIDLTGIGKALSTLRLTVPVYQRSYSWEEKQVIDLLSDIAGAIENGEKEYFLGSIVTTRKGVDRPEVVDGQQRLATTTIILAGIRDYFCSFNDRERAETIESTYLLSRDLATLNLIPTLELNATDNNFFLQTVLQSPDQRQSEGAFSRESHRRICNAQQLVAERMSDLARLHSSAHLIKWVEYLREAVKVIWVEVSDDANAFTIFETLNDRGLALAISDLLKNYLFHLSGDRLRETQDRWLTMVGTLEAVETEEIIITYIRHQWSSRFGLTREKDLYADIKARIRNKPAAITFANNLAADARLYAACLNPDHDLWMRIGGVARQHMATLNVLRMVQIRPLLLAILSAFSDRDIQQALKLIVSWSVRFLIYGGLGSGTLEKRYCERAAEIRQGEVETLKKLMTHMKDVVPSDTQFKAAFLAATVSKSYLARYYLRALERQARGDADPELIPNEDSGAVNLEHIMPISPSKNWQQVSAEDAAAYVNRIGNLALLSTRMNSESGNDSFEAKRKVYADSDFTLTSSLAESMSWGTKEVSERQAQLAELAVLAWPLKV